MVLKNKKGQAAIEFLMTYGWMLLVVLIVGALIFSFVDFGSLLPNRLDLNNNLRADATQMVASAGSSRVSIVFSYVGSRASQINASLAKLKSDLNFECKETGTEDVIVTNLDTNGEGNSSGPIQNVKFINGQLGLIVFTCPSNSNLINGDTLEGTITIPVENIRTGLQVTSRGRLRITIDE